MKAFLKKFNIKLKSFEYLKSSMFLIVENAEKCFRFLKTKASQTVFKSFPFKLHWKDHSSLSIQENPLSSSSKLSSTLNLNLLKSLIIKSSLESSLIKLNLLKNLLSLRAFRFKCSLKVKLWVWCRVHRLNQVSKYSSQTKHSSLHHFKWQY